MKGDVATKAEFQKLTEQVAGGSQSADLPEVEVVDAVSNPGAIPKSHYDGLLSALKDGGMTDSAEQYVRDLDSGARTDRPTAGDGAAARQALGQLMKDPDFRKGVLDGEIQANKTRVALSNVTALANYDDGKPVTEGVLKYLAELGLQ